MIQKLQIQSEKSLEFIDITSQIEEIISKGKVQEGTVAIFSPHTTAGLTINHNEPMLIQDMTRILHKIAPVDERYSHDLFELTNQKDQKGGRDNGHSHCKKMFLSSSEIIPFQNQKLLLGKQQSVFLVELDGARAREVLVQVLG